MTGLEVLQRELLLPEEWQLGAGRRVRFTPKSPTQLDQPGFRDEGTFHSFPIAPVFAISLLDPIGREISISASERNWNPARLELLYRLPHAQMRERRVVLSNDAFVSHWAITHTSDVDQRFWMVLWTLRRDGLAGRRISEIDANPQGISFQESAIDRAGQETGRWACALGGSFDADSWSVNSAESAGPELAWSSTPFVDLMAPGGLPGHLPPGRLAAGNLFFALAYPFEIPPGERLVVSFTAAFAPDIETARHSLERCVALIDPVQSSEEDWINWFEEAPSFTCSDPMLQRHYWYRWSQRRIWSSDGADRSNDFRGGSSAVDCNVNTEIGRVIELSWRHVAESSMEALGPILDLPDESIGNLAVAHAARRVLSIHADDDLRRDVVRRGRRLADRLARDESGMLFASPRPPWSHDPDEPDSLSLARCVHICDWLRLLDELRPETSDEPYYTEVFLRLAQRVRAEFWEDEFYVERVGRRSIKSSIGFYPMLAGLADRTQRAALRNALCDPERFWTGFPMATLSRDDRDFCPNGNWQGRRLDRAAHGRVCLEDTSHVVDAFAEHAERLGAADRVVLAELLHRTLRLAFSRGDVDRPELFAQYNPLSGQPARHLGRSAPSGWAIDHILRYVGGVRPHLDGRLIIDPLPFPIEWFSVRRIFFGERELEVEWDHRTGLTLRIDGELAGHAPVGRSLALSLSEQWVAD